MQMTEARYFNRTHVGCEIPTFTNEEAVQVDLSIDAGVTYSANQVPILLIEAPVILGLNTTEYYYTFNEQVYVELRGLHLDNGEYRYVRVGDQV